MSIRFRISVEWICMIGKEPSLPACYSFSQRCTEQLLMLHLWQSLSYVHFQKPILTEILAHLLSENLSHGNLLHLSYQWNETSPIDWTYSVSWLSQAEDEQIRYICVLNIDVVLESRVLQAFPCKRGVFVQVAELAVDEHLNVRKTALVSLKNCVSRLNGTAFANQLRPAFIGVLQKAGKRSWANGMGLENVLVFLLKTVRTRT